MAIARWRGTIIAESNNVEMVEGNVYFPHDSIYQQYFTASDTHTHCPWKGQAHYYSLNIDGEINIDAAWFYPTASERAKHIENYVAFWKGVEVSDS